MEFVVKQEIPKKKKKRNKREIWNNSSWVSQLSKTQEFSSYMCISIFFSVHHVMLIVDYDAPFIIPFEFKNVQL